MSQSPEAVERAGEAWFEGVASGHVEWSMLNQQSHLVPGHLIHTIGPGNHSLLYPRWPYSPNRGDGIVPINHILRFRTYGEQVKLRQTLHQEHRYRLVVERNAAGAIERMHLHMLCDLYRDDDPGGRLVGHGEFWMALTSPFAPPGERTPKHVPEALSFLREHEPAETDLTATPPEAYRLEGAGVCRERQLVAYHQDRSDIYRHVNTVVYLDQAMDALALLAARSDVDPGALQCRDLTVFFRKPFMPGQLADVDVELEAEKESFAGMVRFTHRFTDETSPGRVSVAIAARGEMGASEH